MRPRRGFRPDFLPLEVRALLASWINQGPASTLGGQEEGIVGTGTVQAPTNPVSGGVEAIAAQPGNANVVYAGTTNGGVWKTTNATAVSPTWTPLTDAQVSLSTGDVEFAPATVDPTFQTLYVGTGSFSSAGQDGTPGRGLLKTTDGGTTWANINPGGIFNGRYVKSVVPTALGGGGVLLVGTFYDGGGVYRSTNGGTTFARISGNGTSGLPNAGVSIVVPDPNNPSVFYAGVPGSGVYRTNDGGVTWAAKNVGIASPATSNSRVELAASPTAGVVFAALLNNGVPNGFYRSTNGGDTWTPMDLAGTNESGGFVGTNPEAEEEEEDGDLGGDGPPGGQGSIHFALLADRADPNVVYVSGDRQNDPFPNAVGSNAYSGRAFRGDASLPSGQQWTPITNNFANPDGVTAGTSPHADSRDMVFDANGNILQGNDGGIYRLVNPGGTQATRGWVSVVGNLRNTEFISTAYSSLTHTIIGGAQDTGTHVQTSTDPAVPWSQLLQSDGGFVGVDDISVPGSSIRYSSYYGFQFFNRTTWNAANQPTNLTPVGLIVNGTGGQNLLQFDPNVRFYQPFKLNAVAPSRMVIGTNSLYESTNRGDNLTFLGSPGTIYGMAYGGRYRGAANPDVLYLGTFDSSSNPHLYVRTAANGPFVDLQARYAAGGGFVARDIILDPQDYRRAFTIDFNGGVYATFNAGATWISVTSNINALAPGGAGDLRSIGFVGNSANYDNSVLVVGGYGGVFASRSPGLAGTTTTWSRLGDSLSNALVVSLQYNAADDVLVAGTLGRGSWTLPNPAASAPPPPGADGSPGVASFTAETPGDETQTPWEPLLPDTPIASPPPSRGDTPPAPRADPADPTPDPAVDPDAPVLVPLITPAADPAAGPPIPTTSGPVPVLIGLPASKRKGVLVVSPSSGSTGN